MENRFSIGAVLGAGFKIWFKNLIPFLLITLLIYIPLIVWGVSIANGDLDLKTLERFDTYHGASVLLLNLFAAAAITYGVVMELQGQHAGIGACFATGIARFFPVLGVALLSALCVAGGLLALIVPGIIVFCMLYVATPAAVLERPGVMGALKRSRELTAGHKMEIFGLLFLIGLINYALSTIAQEVIVKPDAVTFDNLRSVIKRLVYAQIALNIVIGSLSAVMSAVAYYYLRSEKEGTSATELARVFE